MERGEKIGLLTAFGGHVLLLGLLSAGLVWANIPDNNHAISVSLVGEIAEFSTAPDAIEEDAAPEAAEAEPEKVEEVIPPKPEPVKPEPKPVERPKPVAKPKEKEKAVKEQPRPAPKPQGFSKNFENVIASASKQGGQGQANGTPASKPAAEVRRSISASLASQIKPYLEACTPSGIDIDVMRTFITLNLAEDGRLINVNFDKQTGITANNRPQAEPLKQCALRAVRQASPYYGLDPEFYDIWKSHALQLKAR